ncbi:hypothetical protein KY327_01140 [Candidatus Woesearchaeota archaeon]|nr:hypothetical protein [Candidatus Woesearchaeota archaeon]
MDDDSQKTILNILACGKDRYGVTALPQYEQPAKDIKHNESYGLTYIGGITAANLTHHVPMEEIPLQKHTKELFLYTNHYEIPPLEDLIQEGGIPPVLNPRQGLWPNTTEETAHETLELLLDKPTNRDLNHHLVYRSLFLIKNQKLFEEKLSADDKKPRIINDKYVAGDTILTPRF